MTAPAGFTIEISPDGLEARARFAAAPPASQEVKDALAAQGVCHGILHDEIEALGAAPGGVKAAVLVASGDPPVAGSPGRVEKLVEPGGTVAPRLFMDGSVDFRQASRFTRVKKGARLFRRVRSRPGIAGVDVRGRPIPVLAPPERDFSFSPLSFVPDPDDPTFQVAACDGVLVETEEGLAIRPELVIVIEGDVGPTTGNIDFPGHVAVCGSIRAGFSVKAGGGLEVDGSVEPCSIEVRGDLVVREGILGARGLSVAATGNAAARFAENARISCGGDLLLERSALNCQLTARGSVYVRGNLVSGSTIASRRVEAQNLGSPLGVPLQVCLGYTSAVCDALDAIFDERVEIGRRWGELAQEGARLAGQGFLKHRDPGRVPEGARERARALLMEVAALEESLERLAARQNDLIRDKRAAVPDATLVFGETLHPDVAVHIGSLSARFLESIAGPMSLTGKALVRAATPVALWLAEPFRFKVEEGLREVGYRNFLLPPQGILGGDPLWLAAARMVFLEPAQAGAEAVGRFAQMRQAGRLPAVRIVGFSTGDPVQDRTLLEALSVDVWVLAPKGELKARWFAQTPLDRIL